jgi:hypothetical protein
MLMGIFDTDRDGTITFNEVRIFFRISSLLGMCIYPVSFVACGNSFKTGVVSFSNLIEISPDS